jgi:hypothetical protein
MLAWAEDEGHLTAGCDDALTDIMIPSGRPNHRFMRYVRPPTKDSDTRLFPLRPDTVRCA